MAIKTYTKKYDSVTGVAVFDVIDVHFKPTSAVASVQVNPFVYAITDTAAIVSFSTTVATSYGLYFKNNIFPEDGKTSYTDGAFTDLHQINLLNLKPSTTYTFSVTAQTIFGLQVTSANVSFTTLASSTTTTPITPTIDTTPAEILSANVPSEWDVNANSTINCTFYVNTKTDYVKYYFPNQPNAQSDGSIIVNPTTINGNKGALITLVDPLALGNYTLAVIAGNGVVGDGVIKYYNIKVDKLFVYAQPDITYIDYPKTIVEPDFKAFQYNFDFKLTSVNAESIEIYVGDSTAGKPPVSVTPVGSPTTNISFTAKELFASQPTAWKTATSGPLGVGSYYVLTFSFIPFVNGVKGKIYGKTEVVTVNVKRTENFLTDAQVTDYLVKKFTEFLTINSDLLLFDNERYLKYHLKHQDITFDSYVISNFGKDDVTFSIPTGKTYDPTNAVPTEYILDPETGNTTRKYPPYKSLIVKLFEPLPPEIEINTQLWIAKQLVPAVIEDIIITDDDVKACIPLQPNFNADVLEQTGYQYFNDILGTSTSTSTDIVNTYLSQSAFNLTDLAIDYTSGSIVTAPVFLKFENFVNFSSAKTRIENFQYKLSAIEFWENKISSSLYIGDTPPSNIFAIATSQSYTNNITNIKNGFDGFESKMYTDYSVTSSNSNFFSYQSTYADDYDKYNKNYLVNHLPTYLIEGSGQGENDEFILFLEMIGQHFDVLWAYIKGIHRAKIIRNSAEEGIPDKLVHTLLENLGWVGQQPFGGMQLWKEAFGLNADGTTFTNTNILGNYVASSYTPDEARKQVWRRILNNLPYLLKHKGTRRAIYAIMACYGIPSSMLSVVEFSANSLSTARTDTTTTQNFTYTTQTAQLNLGTGSNVSIPYYSEITAPTAVQVRFATQYQIPTASSATGSQLIRKNVDNSDSYWQINLLPTWTGSYSQVNFIISSASNETLNLSITSSVIFDNYHKNITIQKERFNSASVDYDRFTLYVKEASTDRIIMNQSASLVVTASGLTDVFTDTGSLYFGGIGITPGISGTLDEVRLWNSALSESVITAHALNPDVIYGNDLYSTTNNLLVRLDFEYPKDRIADPYIKNVSPKVEFSGSTAIAGYTGYATASMVESAPSYPYHYTVYNRTATSKVPKLGFSANDKIRTYTQETVTNLSPKQRASKKITETTPIDSNRLGVFFSPVKELNLDILHSLGDINIGDYIGSWGDEYGKDSYDDLKTLKSYYFQRTNLDFNEYIKLIKSVDSSFYKMLEQIPGGRVKLMTGLLIEPSILDRSKIKINKPSGDNEYHTASISYGDEFALTGESDEYEIVFNQTDFSKELDTEYTPLTSSIENTSIYSVNAENNTINSTSSYNIFNNLLFDVKTVYSYGSNGASIDAYINSKYENATILGEYDLELAYENVGMDMDSPFNSGFGVVGEGGAVDRTYRRYDGTLVLTERSNAYLLTIKYTRDVPNTNISGVTTYETMSFYEKKLLFVSQSDPNAGGDFRSPSQHSFYTYITSSLGAYPYDNGVVTNIELFNGYTSGHYRFTKDTTRGLENSRFNGSKQTSLTTLDGTAAVEIFSTNANTLKVSNTGRGSGEPILEVT